ncbi:MAG: AAA family ATPase [Egibacteraceae bacterium]
MEESCRCAFVERSAHTLAIDEAQLEPRLFRAIKASVDRDRRPGRFLLTGSSRLLAAPDMADARSAGSRSLSSGPSPNESSPPPPGHPSSTWRSTSQQPYCAAGR